MSERREAEALQVPSDLPATLNLSTKNVPYVKALLDHAIKAQLGRSDDPVCISDIVSAADEGPQLQYVHLVFAGEYRLLLTAGWQLKQPASVDSSLAQGTITSTATVGHCHEQTIMNIFAQSLCCTPALPMCVCRPAAAGMLGITYVGFLWMLETAGIRFLGLGGSSAGAITAGTIATMRERSDKPCSLKVLEVCGPKSTAMTCCCLRLPAWLPGCLPTCLPASRSTPGGPANQRGSSLMQHE